MIMDTPGRLREHGLKATPQRIALYEALASTDSHPTAEEIHRHISRSHPAVSLNTVYTSLEAMVSARLVRRVQTGECVYRYDARIAPHAHLVCTACDGVRDVNGALGDRLVALAHDAAQTGGHTIEDQDLYVYGLCPPCQQRKETHP